MYSVYSGEGKSVTFRQFAYRNVFRNGRIYAAFFMASCFSVAVFFIYSMLMFHPNLGRGVLGEVSLVGMAGAEVILVLFTLFFLFYSMSAFLAARSREFGILLHLGMERRQLNRLVFIETMVIGIASIVIGIIFGFSFSKFFFMIVREMLYLEHLPLYLGWAPFLLTIGVFTSAFVIISYLSVSFSREYKVLDLLRGIDQIETSFQYSIKRAIKGVVYILVGYGLIIFTSYFTGYLALTIFVPLLITFGTYYFFSDTTLLLLAIVRRKRKINWRRFRLLAIAEQTHIMKNNAKMFFVVTMVSTLAFLSVGVLATMSSYTTQYNLINPMGLIYKGDANNPYEGEHIRSLTEQLEERGLSYHLTRFVVVKQTSSATKNEVEVLRESDINRLLYSYNYPMVNLQEGEAMFIPNTEEDLQILKDKVVHTVLEENDIAIQIDRVYPRVIFPKAVISVNSIILSDEDFEKLWYVTSDPTVAQPVYHLFTFDVSNWMETKDITLDVDPTAMLNKNSPYKLENAGLNYSYIVATYSLFTLVVLLVATVFLLASGSFIYFKLHAALERNQQQFAVLRRMGLTDSELKKLVNRYLFPQFFVPWGLALLHCTFAFAALQLFLKDLVNISIAKEVILAFSFLIMIQVIYFYLIRWRYIAHVRS